MEILRRHARFETAGLYVQINSTKWVVAPPGVDMPPSIIREARQEVHPSSSCVCAPCMTRRRLRQETPSFLFGEDPQRLSPTYREMFFFKLTDLTSEVRLKSNLNDGCSVTIITPGEADRERAMVARDAMAQEARRGVVSSRPIRVPMNSEQAYVMSRYRQFLEAQEGSPMASKPKKEKPLVEKVVKGRRIRTRPEE